jgi:ankyrin repeat protein
MMHSRTGIRLKTIAVVLAAAAPYLLAAGTPDLFQAIRSGDARAVKAQLRAGADKDAPGDAGLTPLMYAVMTAGEPVMQALLRAGANVNAANPDGVTALHIASFDARKTRLLIDAGAGVNAATKAGETPLFVASTRSGNVQTAALLLTKGANASAKTATGLTALGGAALFGDAALMRLLIANRAKAADTPDLARAAAAGHCFECLKLALDQGASANGATRNGRSALQDAAGFGHIDMVRLLVEKGADIQAADSRGYTAVMRAVLSYEPGSSKVVEYLLSLGADLKSKNETGETALSLALRFGETQVAAMLRKAGAPEPRSTIRVPEPLAENTVREAIERSLPLLQRIGEPVYKLRGCTSCHHNTLPALTVAMARSRGFRVDEAAARKEYDTAIATAGGRRNRTNVLGIGVPDINPYPLIGIAAENSTPNQSTDEMVHHVSTRQEPGGRFRGFDYRPPQEYSDITFTASALRAMQLFQLPGRTAEFKDRIQRAGKWLASQKPRDTEEHALRLMGLVWAGADKPALQDAIRALLALQREDGGWAQTAGLYTDAYATGESLYALYLAGVAASHEAYQRGVGFLLKSQRKNGSWFVASRSHPVQPLFDAGFPYIRHQWISAAASAWSTMALLATVPEPTGASPRAKSEPLRPTRSE